MFTQELLHILSTGLLDQQAECVCWFVFGLVWLQWRRDARVESSSGFFWMWRHLPVPLGHKPGVHWYFAHSLWDCVSLSLIFFRCFPVSSTTSCYSEWRPTKDWSQGWVFAIKWPWTAHSLSIWRLNLCFNQGKFLYLKGLSLNTLLYSSGFST